MSHLVRNTVPCASSCGAVPVKKLATVPCANSAAANPNHSWRDHNHHASAAVATASARWPPACSQPCRSLRRMSRRSVAGATGDRYHATRNRPRTSANGG